MLKESDQVQSQFSTERELCQLEKLKILAENHICYSAVYLRRLKRKMRHRNALKMNTDNQETFEEGFFYLKNACCLVEVYQDCVPISIDNKDIQKVNDMLVALEFDPKHITSEHTDQQDTKYYKLLHSGSKKSFAKMVEPNIDIPIKEFLKSIEQRLQSILSEELSKKSTEIDKPLIVEYIIRKELSPYLKNKIGRTPLHCCVNNGNIDIVTYLLKHGADATEITINGETSLHIASFKGHREIIELLLRYVNYNKLNEFINAKTIDGTTSLHVAAKNNLLEIVKSLLQHGAIYNVKDKEDKIPIDLSINQRITNLLKLIEELFRDTKVGNIEIISKLKALKSDEFLAITNTRNNQGNTLLQVAIDNKHNNIVKNLEMLIKANQKLEKNETMTSKSDRTIVKRQGKCEENVQKAFEELRKDFEGIKIQQVELMECIKNLNEGINRQQGEFMEDIKKLNEELVKVRKLVEDKKKMKGRRNRLKREEAKRESRRFIRQERIFYRERFNNKRGKVEPKILVKGIK